MRLSRRHGLVGSDGGQQRVGEPLYRRYGGSRRAASRGDGRGRRAESCVAATEPGSGYVRDMSTRDADGMRRSAAQHSPSPPS